MSLRVWLPLLGNTDNQGLSDLTFSVTHTNTAVNNNGKIGKCYANSTNNYGGIISDKAIDLGTTVSMACWFKYTSLEASAGLGGSLVSQHCYNDNTGLGITIKYVSATTGYISCSTGTGSSRTFNTYYGTTLLQANTWYHATLTYDGTTIKLYLNGVLEKSVDYAQKNKSNHIGVFAWSINNGAIYGDYKLIGSINDVRIYDHALSPKEIKLLSQGLVCHYQLNDAWLEGTTNLITSLTQGGQTTISGNSVTTSGQNKDTYFTINLSESIVSGTQYTISCYAEGIPDDSSWTFPLGAQSNTSLSWVIHNGYNAYTFTANSINWGTNRIFMDDMSRTFYGITKFSNFQLEKKDHATGYAGMGGTRNDTTVYDSSGYNYHGTSEGTITVDAITPRYDVSTHFSIGSGIFAHPNITLSQFTIAFWAKHSVANKMLMGSNASISSTNGNWYWYGDNSFKYYGGEYYYEHNAGSAESLLGTWIHFVATYDGANLTVYRNGVNEGSKAVTGAKPLEYLSIGNGYTSGYREAGNVSDFRLYSTALSADDILELYHTSTSIDKDGNMFAYEYIEN